MDETVQVFDGSTLTIEETRLMQVYKQCQLMMVIFTDGSEIPMIEYTDGTVFCPRDWQSIPPVFSTDDVVNLSWCEISTGREAIMLDGLPRLGF